MQPRAKRGATRGQDYVVNSDQRAAPKARKNRAASQPPRDAVPAVCSADAEAAQQCVQKHDGTVAAAEAGPSVTNADIMAAIMQSRAMMAGLQQQVRNLELQATRVPVKELNNASCNLLQNLGLQMQTDSEGNKGERCKAC